MNQLQLWAIGVDLEGKGCRKCTSELFHLRVRQLGYWLDIQTLVEPAPKECSLPLEHSGCSLLGFGETLVKGRGYCQLEIQWSIQSSKAWEIQASRSDLWHTFCSCYNSNLPGHHSFIFVPSVPSFTHLFT